MDLTMIDLTQSMDLYVPGNMSLSTMIDLTQSMDLYVPGDMSLSTMVDLTQSMDRYRSATQRESATKIEVEWWCGLLELSMRSCGKCFASAWSLPSYGGGVERRRRRRRRGGGSRRRMIGVGWGVGRREQGGQLYTD